VYKNLGAKACLIRNIINMQQCILYLSAGTWKQFGGVAEQVMTAKSHHVEMFSRQPIRILLECAFHIVEGQRSDWMTHGKLTSSTNKYVDIGDVDVNGSRHRQNCL